MLQTYEISQSFENVALEPIIKQRTNNFSKYLLVLVSKKTRILWR